MWGWKPKWYEVVWYILTDLWENRPKFRKCRRKHPPSKT